MLALSEVIQRIWPALRRGPAVHERHERAAAWVSAVALCLLCLRQLARKVRAHEVVS
jgi:hypothetical protein